MSTTAEPSALFETLDRALETSSPAEALDHLATLLADRGEFRALLDARLLRARLDLGLPLVQAGSLTEIPEPTRTQYEERYVEAIREVGRLLLGAGEIGAAWAYFRAIAEKEPVFDAIEAYQPLENDERIGQVIEVAFNQGVHPRKGFGLILDHYGTCSSISAFESLPPDEAVRVACADRLVRRLHDDLKANLRAEIARRGQPLPPEGTSIGDLIAGREWLFVDDAYHLDVSHLASTVRLSPLLVDLETVALALGLTDYGRNLSERHRYEGDPPFEDHYGDHAVYLRALLGRDVEEAIAHFRAKLPATDPDGRDEAIAAQVLVRLLIRLGRIEEALEIAAEHLAHLPDSALACPSVAQLCQSVNRLDRLAEIARGRGDLVNYAAARLSK
jgi:tetratricopeptide (TPR) repeat protein